MELLLPGYMLEPDEEIQGYNTFGPESGSASETLFYHFRGEVL
jgi:hypothetical protein